MLLLASHLAFGAIVGQLYGRSRRAPWIEAPEEPETHDPLFKRTA
jgi:hypothetical protein